jgi:cell division septation protein DedD
MVLSGRSDRLSQESRRIELPPKPEELSIETRRFPVGTSQKAASAAGQAAPRAGRDEPRQNARSTGTSVAVGAADGPGDISQQESGLEEKPVVAADTEKLIIGESPGGKTDTPAGAGNQQPGVTSIVLESGRDKGLDIFETTNASQDAPRYLVQVASFSSEKNANALAGRLRSEGLPVLMDVVDRSAGRLHRVRVGPYMEQSEADAVVTSLRSTMKDLTPRVLDLRPADSAPVSTPSDPLVRWVVQVGSFSNAERAGALVAELRVAGMPAFSEKVSSANGTVYKVRIGPELERSKAVELARKVKAQHPDAFVTTQE